jgi:hypothetical protein
MTLLHRRVWTLEKANKALAKRRKAKRLCIKVGGVLSIEDAQELITQRETVKR